MYMLFQFFMKSHDRYSLFDAEKYLVKNVKVNKVWPLKHFCFNLKVYTFLDTECHAVYNHL